jgi:hypothetical protein
MDMRCPITVHIEPAGLEEPIRGRLETPFGETKHFSGWIGLVAAIESARAETSAAQENRAARAGEVQGGSE